MAINGNQCHREVSIALLHLEATSLTTCNALPTLMRLYPFDWLHTDGRFPPRCIPPPLASRLSAAVTTIRLEHVSSNFSVEMARAFDGLLPSLRLPPWTRVAATGAADSGGSPKPSPSELGHGRGDGDQSTERLVQAAAKFDLSHHAPPPDKLDHVSDKDAKQRLREVLLNDKRLRPLLRGLRLSLGYEAMPAWQPPPDIAALSAAIERTVASFCQGPTSKGWECRK